MKRGQSGPDGIAARVYLVRMRLLFLTIIAATGCAGSIVESGGFKVNKAQTERAFEEVRNRAAFELHCARERIEEIVLNVGLHDALLGDPPTQIGASGCGQRAVYVTSNSGWVLDSTSTQPPRSSP
jgi:hypothetical protein